MPLTRISAFALGALLTLGVFVLTSQTLPSSYTSWGPPKKSILNIFKAPGGSIPGGGALVIHQVPPDRWLTLTGVYANAAGCMCPGGPTGSDPCLRWAEQYAGIVTEKGWAIGVTTELNFNPAAAGSTLGWVFRPGSQVIVRNVDGSACALHDYSLIGYETRD